MNQDSADIRRILHPVENIDQAVEFYRQSLGFSVGFVDGDRYASLQAGATKLDLAGAAEDVTEGRAAAVAKVLDVPAAVARVQSAGGSVARAPERGPHETRAVVSDPWGNLVVLYAPN